MKKLHVERVKGIPWCGRKYEPEVYWRHGGVPYIIPSGGGSIMINIDRICKACMRVMGVDYKEHFR